MPCVTGMISPSSASTGCLRMSAWAAATMSALCAITAARRRRSFFKPLLGGGLAQFDLARLLQREDPIDFVLQTGLGQFVDGVHRGSPLTWAQDYKLNG